LLFSTQAGGITFFRSTKAAENGVSLGARRSRAPKDSVSKRAYFIRSIVRVIVLDPLEIRYMYTPLVKLEASNVTV